MSLQKNWRRMISNCKRTYQMKYSVWQESPLPRHRMSFHSQKKSTSEKQLVTDWVSIVIRDYCPPPPPSPELSPSSVPYILCNWSNPAPKGMMQGGENKVICSLLCVFCCAGCAQSLELLEQPGIWIRTVQYFMKENLTAHPFLPAAVAEAGLELTLWLSHSLTQHMLAVMEAVMLYRK